MPCHMSTNNYVYRGLRKMKDALDKDGYDTSFLNDKASSLLENDIKYYISKKIIKHSNNLDILGEYSIANKYDKILLRLNSK